MTTGSERQRKAVRDCSAALFGGAQYRLEVCEALQSGQTVTVSGLLDGLPTPPSKASVHAEVQRLIAAGLLVPMPRVPGDRRVYLRVGSTSLWHAARELAAAARKSASAPPEQPLASLHTGSER